MIILRAIIHSVAVPDGDVPFNSMLYILAGEIIAALGGLSILVTPI